MRGAECREIHCVAFPHPDNRRALWRETATLVRLDRLAAQVSAIVFNPRREGRGETRPSQIVVVA